jgi:hypothetical protein
VLRSQKGNFSISIDGRARWQEFVTSRYRWGNTCAGLENENPITAFLIHAFSIDSSGNSRDGITQTRDPVAIICLLAFRHSKERFSATKHENQPT